ncbi:hypothetical protein J6590_056236 [Homalodisca vitripennis]|nr:hypothetical protein J6590_056236 [Homalodisca vitripennis]
MFGIYRYCSALPPLFLSACHDHPIENKREELVAAPRRCRLEDKDLDDRVTPVLSSDRGSVSVHITRDCQHRNYSLLCIGLLCDEREHVYLRFSSYRYQS